MRAWHIGGIVAAVWSMACEIRPVPQSDRADAPVFLDTQHAAAIEDSVRVFAESVAAGVSRDGPVAWRIYFEKSPAFFMASDGLLVFPSSDSATRAIQSLARMISHIDLHWGDDMRVDPLAPGLAILAASWHEVRVDASGHHVDERGFFTGAAEDHAGVWQLRDAHWSAQQPGPPVH